MCSHRRQADDRRKQRVTAKRRGQIKAILVSLGLWDGVRTTNLRDRFLQCYYPRVEVTLADDLVNSNEATALLDKMQRAVKSATFDCPILGDKFLATDYFSFVKPLMDVLHTADAIDQDLRAFLKAARDRTNGLASADTAALATCELFRVLDDVAIKVGRIDQRLYYLKCEHGRKQNGKWFLRFVMHGQKAQTKIVKTQHGSRPAFRCGQPFGWKGIEWVEWPASVLGEAGEQHHYPVYVQSHAIDNLYRREARAMFIKDGEWLVHDYLWQSLREPKVTPMRGSPGKHLVEFCLNCHKLGYFVVEKVDDIVLVESFLFLTMNGTPEGDLLWKNLRLHRADKEYLGLDKIEYFLITDVQHDPELVTILGECGCGHLFRVLKDPPRERLALGYAKDLRSHLGYDR